MLSFLEISVLDALVQRGVKWQERSYAIGYVNLILSNRQTKGNVQCVIIQFDEIHIIFFGNE